MPRLNSASCAFLLLAAVVFNVASDDRAQSREQYLISAKAGAINALAGDVVRQRRAGTTWQRVTAHDELSSGDVLRTGTGGRVEVLLNPGSYLRLAENAELELTDASLDHLQLRLNKGSAVIEATGASRASLLTTLVTPQAKLFVVKNGLYRINVAPDQTTTVLVRKGQLLVGDQSSTAVKEKREALISAAGHVEVTKFDLKAQDDFDLWSKQRAETLTAANRRLSERSVNIALANLARNGWSFNNSTSFYGLWIYNPFLSCRTFYPIYSGWSSPYGFGYRNGFGVPAYYYGYGSVSLRPPAPRNGGGGDHPPPPTLIISAPNGDDRDAPHGRDPRFGNANRGDRIMPSNVYATGSQTERSEPIRRESVRPQSERPEPARQSPSSRSMTERPSFSRQQP